MAKLTVINNPINQRDKTVSKIDGGLALFHLLNNVYEDIEFIVAVNGKITEDYEYIVKQEDHVMIVPIPKGGDGGGKEALMIVAMIAITIATAGATSGFFATSGGLFAAGSASAMALGAAISVGGGMLVSSLASTPSTGLSSSSLEDVSATYGYGTLPNATTVGTSLPIVLGKRRVVPPVINRFLSLSGDKQYLNILMAVNDGEVDSINEIMLNEQSIDNFNNVDYEVRYGTNNQALLNTFRDSKSTINLQRSLNTNGATTTYTTDGNSIQGLEVVMSLPSGLYKMNDAGNREVHSLSFQIRYRKEGTEEWFYHLTAGYQYFVYVYDITSKFHDGYIGRKEYNSFKGDTFKSGVYIYKFVKKYAVQVDPSKLIVIDTIYKTAQRLAYSIEDLSIGRYEVEVIRTSDYSEDTRTANQLTLDYVNEVVYDDFTYPNVALLSVTAMATDQLSSFPSVSALVINNTIKGTTKSKSNPAWACYDLLQREGISDTDIDMDAFEEWANYCDEENFSVSLYLDTQQDLQTALNMISLSGRATVVQFGSRFTPLVEKLVELPTQSFLFTSGNIIDSSFQMATIPYVERSNVVEVTYYDEDDDYNAKTEQVQSFDFDANTREIKSSISLYGCTSEEIAKRYAKFCLNKNRYITSTVSFTASVDAIACSVGDVILVGVKGMTNTLADGRLREVVGNSVVLDSFVALEKDEIYELQVRTENDMLISYDYVHTASSTETDTLNISLLHDVENAVDVVYAFGKQVSKSTNLYRVGSITRDSDFKRKITAIEYNESVYDDDVEIELEEIVSLPGVTNLIASEMLLTKIDGSVDEIIALSWEGNSLSYDIYLDGTKIGSTDSNSYVIKDIFVKTKIYKIKVNDLQITHTYNGAGTPLSTVQNVSSIYNNGVYTVIWDASEDVLFDYYEVVINGATHKTTNTFFEISTLPNGIYNLLIYSVNTLGEKSTATDYQLTINEKTIGTIAVEADAKVNQVVTDMTQNIERLDATIEQNSQSLVSTVETLTSSIETAEQSIDDLGQETLDNFAQTEIKIQESKTIAQSADGKWEANAETLILGEDGKLTGIHAKANNNISEVVISADKFKLESSIGNPFSVIDGEIYNNGKVNFANNPNIATKDDLLSVNKTLFTNTESDLLMTQAGTNLSLEIQNIENYTNNDSFTIETSLSYKDGCIFSFQVNSLDALTSSQEGQFFTVSLVDINTGTEDLAFSCFFYIDNTNTTIMTAYYASSALYQKYIDDNPGSDFNDAYSFYDFKKDENGDWKSIYESLNDIITFVYDDNNLIIQENGIERGRAEVGANKTYKATVTANIYKEFGTNDLKNGVNLEINKWDRYYNNTNLVSEIQEVTQNLTALTSSTASEQFSLNNKILNEAQERAEQDALIDNKVTAEEQARISALTNIQEEYKNYTNIVAKALADEVITPEEQAVIDVAWDSVQSAKNRLTSIETQLNEIDKVEDINWQTEVQNAINDDATTIDGGKLVTNEAFVNNLNAQGGIVADDISAETFYGKRFEGSIFVGAVIKASYIDLDGELEVLTNYHIAVATYNSNPNAYSDAVYIEADDEYRIPSLSTVREVNTAKNMSAGAWLYGKIMAYDVANAGHNVKAVKIKPTVLLTSSVEIFRFYFGMSPYLNNNYVYSSTSGVMRCNIYVMGTSVPIVWNLTTINGSSGGDDSGAGWATIRSGQVSINGSTTFNNVTAGKSKPYREAGWSSSAGSASSTKTINGIPITFTLTVSMGTGGIGGSAGTFDLRATIPAGTYEVNENFLNSHFLKFYCSQKATPKTTSVFQAKISNAIAINNMI